MSTSKRPAPDKNQTDDPRKAHKSAPDEGTSTQAQEPFLVPTNVDNVHEISGDATPSMASIRSQTPDWSDPVIVVVTRETTDIFLQYLHKITNDSATNTTQGQDLQPMPRTDEDTGPVFCDNNYSTQAEFNKSTMDIIEQKFDSTVKQLDSIQYHFTLPLTALTLQVADWSFLYKSCPCN